MKFQSSCNVARPARNDNVVQMRAIRFWTRRVEMKCLVNFRNLRNPFEGRVRKTVKANMVLCVMEKFAKAVGRSEVHIPFVD